jgi:hypothetical protein
LEEKKNEIKGKIVFYNAKFNPEYIQTFFALHERRYWGSGAAGQPDMVLGYPGSSMTESVDNNPHTGAMNYKDSIPKFHHLRLGFGMQINLHLISAGKNVRVYLKTNAHMLPDTIGYNVIGKSKARNFQINTL